MTLFDADAAIAAVRSGTIDASFRAVTMPARRLPDGIRAARVLDEPVQLLTGPAHEFATACAVTPAELARHRIWMPSIVTGTEWAAYYDELAGAFGLTIDPSVRTSGPSPCLDALAGSAELATFVGEQTWVLWPARLRPAAHCSARPDTGLPALTDLAQRQPAPRTHQTPHPPRLHPVPPPRRRQLDPELGTALNTTTSGDGLHRVTLVGSTA